MVGSFNVVVASILCEVLKIEGIFTTIRLIFRTTHQLVELYLTNLKGGLFHEDRRILQILILRIYARKDVQDRNIAESSLLA